MNIIKILEEESKEVAKLFYDYNALIDLMTKIENPKSDFYADLVYKLQNIKYELEMKKSSIIKKYCPDYTGDYSFDFLNSELILK